jgi:hypothetical protein
MELLKSLFPAALLCVGMVGCTVKESHEAIVMAAVGLDSAKDYWIEHGRPDNFNPASVEGSSAEHYYAFTNDISAGGQTYRCLFAVRSDRIRTPGAIAITDDGTILWIYDKDKKVIVSPQRNGIEVVKP